MADINKLANELWMQIFESITDPSDINKVLQTCQKFYALAIRALSQKVLWRDPRHFASNLQFWQNNPSFCNLPRDLTIAFSAVRSLNPGESHHDTSIVALNGVLYVPPPPANIGQIQFFHHHPLTVPITTHHPRCVASIPLYRAMSDLVYTFTGLEKLVFRKAFLPSNVYAIIHALPALATLDILFCTLPLSTGTSYNHSTLPLTNLTLRGLEGAVGEGPQSNLFQVLSLCTAQNLSKLHVDYTSNVFQIFTHPSGAYAVPRQLRRLDVNMPVSKYWPSDALQADTLLIQPFTTFLGLCPTIQRLTITNHMPTFTLAPSALPCLHSYKGPLATVLTVIGQRPMEYLDISDSGKSIGEFTNALSLVAENHRELKTLCVFVPKWDVEVLYAVTQLYPNLRRLKIIYNHGSPSEDTILGLGARFLSRLPNLHDVQIYNPLTDSTDHIFNTKSSALVDTHGVPIDIDWHDSFSLSGGTNTDQTQLAEPMPPPDAEEELKELILAWRRYCPNLREVQLVPGFVWRRAHDGDEWCKRKFEWLDGERNFVL